MSYFLILALVYVMANIDIASNNDKKLSLMLLLLLGFIISLFIGLRWNVGSDWDVYLNNYNFVHSEQFEIGYVFFEKLFYSSYLDYSYFLLFISSISIALIFTFLFKRVDYAIIAIMFFIANYMLSFMGGNRQIIAIGLVFCSNIFIIERNKYKFVSCVLFACFFHASSIIYLVAYFFTVNYMSVTKRYVVLFSCVIFSAYIAPIMIEAALQVFTLIGFGYIVNKLTVYQSVVFDNFSILSLLKKVIMLVFFDLFYKQVTSRERREFTDLFYNLYFFSVIFDSIVGPINAAFMRASVYFRLSEIVIVSLIVATAKNKIQRIVLAFVFFVLCVRQLNSAINFYPELYMNYQNILFGF